MAKGTITSWSCDPSVNGLTTAGNETDYVLGPGGEQVTEMAQDANGTMNWQRTYVYAGSALIGTYDPNPDTPGQPLLSFRLTDWLGTLRATTDGNGVAQGACVGLPYGDKEACSGNPSDNHYFTGKERDAESGNDYFGARYYASSMGRWLSPDPGWFMFANMLNPQSLNLYSHALNSPLVWIDTDGLELVRAVLSNGKSVVVDRSIAGDVMSLVDDAQAAGLSVTVTSGFRSIAQENQMHDKWIQGGRKGYPVGIAKNGHYSGHNSGQAIDISTRRMSAAQRSQLGALGRQNGLPYAGAVDAVHFGAGYGNPVDPGLVIENNANPYPDSTIVDGGSTTVVVNETDNTTTIVEDTSNLIEDQITPIDTQNLPLTPQPPDPPPPPPPPPPPQNQNQQ